MRKRIKTTIIDGKYIVVQVHRDIWTRYGIKVTSESPAHAEKCVRKFSAFKYRLLNAPIEVKNSYSENARLMIHRLFPQVEHYKKAIGINI